MDGLSAPADGADGQPTAPEPIEPVGPAPAAPGTGRSAAHRSGTGPGGRHRRRDRRIGSVVLAVAGLALGLAALVTLAVGSVHLAHQTTAVTDPAQVHSYQMDSHYYACLDTQARSLIHPGQPVRLTGNLPAVVTLGKVVGGWAVLTTSDHVVQLTLLPAQAGGCYGFVVVGRFPDAGRRPDHPAPGPRSQRARHDAGDLSTTGGAVVTLAVLAAAGALPTVALVGVRWPSLVIAPLAGSVLAAVSAMAVLALAGTLMAWFSTLAAVGAGASVLWWVLRPAARPWARGVGAGAPDRRRPDGAGLVAGLVGVVVVTLAVVWSLQPLRVPDYGFDARAIYLLHAFWYTGDHRSALHSLRNPSLLFSQAVYPPLTSASVALSWLVTGTRSYRQGVVVIAVLNGCAVASCAWVLVDAGRAVAASRPATLARRLVPLAAGVTAAGMVAVAAFGIAGSGATNGYADLLWSASVAAAVGYGLVLSGRGTNLGAVVVLLGVAALTKNEAIVTSMAVVVLVAGRTARRRWCSTPRASPWPPLGAGLAGLAALAVWPGLCRVLGATRVTGGTEPGSFSFRVHTTWDAAVPYVHSVGIALVVAVLGGLVLRTVRRATGLGNDLWTWAALAAYLAALAWAYLTTVGSLPFRLLTSINRTTVFPSLMGWFIVAVWAVVGCGALVARDGSEDRPTSARDDTASPEDEPLPGPADEPSPGSLADAPT